MFLLDFIEAPRFLPIFGNFSIFAQFLADFHKKIIIRPFIDFETEIAALLRSALIKAI